jgi:hypothetical protein
VLTFLHFYDDVPDWSDGMNEQWWAGIGGPVGRCPTCSKIIWVDDAAELMPAPREPRPLGAAARLWHRMTGDRNGRLRNEQNWIVLPKEIKNAKHIVALQSADDFLEALAALSCGAEQREAFLRRRLWWASNDHLRLHLEGALFGPLPIMPKSDTYLNAVRLLELIEKNPILQVERGELLRQLGRFDEAVAVLKKVKPDSSSEVRVSKIKHFAQNRDANLKLIKGRL